MAFFLAGLLVVALALWTKHSMSSETGDGRQMIFFWSDLSFGDDIYAVVDQFEHLPENLDPSTGKPKYKVVMGTATSRDVTSDGQRLLCTVAGEVPPDVVFFDRFAIGEWASRGALQNLLPYIKSQRADDRFRLNLLEYYKWTIEETSYRPPGSNEEAGVYGVPLDVDMRLLFCNCDLLRRRGSSIPGRTSRFPHARGRNFAATPAH